MHGLGAALVQELDGLPQLRASHDGVVDEQQVFVLYKFVHRDLLHLGDLVAVLLVRGHKASGPGGRVLDERSREGLFAAVGIADGVGCSGIRHAADVVDLVDQRLSAFPGQVVLREDGAVAVAHGFHGDPFIGGRRIAEVAPQECADALFLAGGLQLLDALRGDLHDLSRAQFFIVFVAQLLVAEVFEGDREAVFILADLDGQSSHPVSGCDQRAVVLQDEDAGGAVDGLLGEADAFREGALLVNEGCDEFRAVDLSAGHGAEVPAGEGQVVVDQVRRIVDDADGGDGVDAQIGTDEQGLGIGVRDAADGCRALHLVQHVAELCTERRILDVVDLPLQAELRVPGGHAAALRP